MSDYDDDNPFKGPKTLDRLTAEMQQHRHDFAEFKAEVTGRWKVIDVLERRLVRFFDEWYGDKNEERLGLGPKVRRMTEEWDRIKWGGRLMVALVTAAASGLGYFIAHYLETHGN